jgi:hypothetical protein
MPKAAKIVADLKGLNRSGIRVPDETCWPCVCAILFGDSGPSQVPLIVQGLGLLGQ